MTGQVTGRITEKVNGRSHPLRVGIAGLGAAGRAFAAPLQVHAGFEWVAAADPDPARALDQQDRWLKQFDDLIIKKAK